MTKKYHRDVWLGLVLLVFCAFVFFNAVKIPGQASYLPVALSVMMAVCALFVTMKGLRLTKELKGEYNYALTVKDSKYAFLFMFLSSCTIWASDISHTGLPLRFSWFFP